MKEITRTFSFLFFEITEPDHLIDQLVKVSDVLNNFYYGYPVNK
jgi:hypothetical protein